MSNRRKRKPSRRERQSGVDRPARRPDDGPGEPIAASSTEDETAAATAPSDTADLPGSITATFKPNVETEATTELEQRHIMHDLRRLGIQLAVFSCLVAGVAILDAQTNVITDLGSSVVGLWE